MIKAIFTKQRIAVLLVALATASAIAALAASTGTATSTDGRSLDGSFCSHAVIGSPFPAGLCIQLTSEGQTTQGYYHSPGLLTLRPGNYWLTVTDNSPVHNFSLTAPDGLDMDITTTPEGSSSSPVVRTVKVHLDHGPYRLICDNDGHAAAGMYVDIEVGGVGQVG